MRSSLNLIRLETQKTESSKKTLTLLLYMSPVWLLFNYYGNCLYFEVAVLAHAVQYSSYVIDIETI